MIQIDLRYIYNLKETLHWLKRLNAGESIRDVYFHLLVVQSEVSDLYDGSVLKSAFRASRVHGRELYDLSLIHI